jgi:hypothetical protein
VPNTAIFDWHLKTSEWDHLGSQSHMMIIKYCFVHSDKSNIFRQDRDC